MGSEMCIRDRVVDLDLGVAVHRDAGVGVPRTARVLADGGVVDHLSLIHI